MLVTPTRTTVLREILATFKFLAILQNYVFSPTIPFSLHIVAPLFIDNNRLLTELWLISSFFQNSQTRSKYEDAYNFALIFLLRIENLTLIERNLEKLKQQANWVRNLYSFYSTVFFLFFSLKYMVWKFPIFNLQTT